MIDYIHTAAYVGVISTLLYLIPLCYWDIKNRSIPKWSFIPLIIVNVPALLLLYTNGLPFAYIALSCLMTALFIFLFTKNCYRGADARFLILISWFCILNPLNPADSSNIFQIIFIIMLAFTSIIWMICVYFYNRRAGNKNLNLWNKFNNYPRGSPWMLPIAAAVILTAVFA
ncbi:MAG: prepilin peptidase [Candidatus Paceibacterota bacterium]|jgi:Flp pilus assembly protein protease CpaA